MKTSEVLNKAADLIEKHGWGRGNGAMQPGFPEGACMEGGIAAAMGVDDLILIDAETLIYSYAPIQKCPAYRAVAEYLAHDGDVWHWNDTLATSASEVIEVLRATAVIEAAREEAAETVNQPTEELAVTW